MGIRSIAAVLMAVLLVSTAGCSAPSPTAVSDPTDASVPTTESRAQPSPVAVVDGSARLDRTNATFSLPLDAYGMNEREQQLAAAAEQIVFARCITGSTEVGRATLDAARAALTRKPPISHWRFGYWDAEYLGAHGLAAEESAATIGDGLEVDPAKAKRCVSAPEYLSVEVITPSHQSQSVEAQALVSAGTESWAGAVADPRFQDIAAKRNRCLADQGYAIDESSRLGGVKLEDSWSAEEQLKAALAEAKCADQLDLAQRAADIEAAYQQRIIEANQAEFVQIRKLADQRVVDAKALLDSVGLG